MAIFENMKQFQSIMSYEIPPSGSGRPEVLFLLEPEAIGVL
jgi:hypothetical protein